jgi:hypothetical protein
VRLTDCQCEFDWQAVAMDDRMDLAAQPASLPAIGLASFPRNAAGVLMEPHNKSVDHLDGGIVSRRKRSHKPAPYAVDAIH